MMTDVNQTPQEIEGSKSNWVRLYELIEENFRYILISLAVYVILGLLGHVPLPDIKRWQVVVASALMIGRYIVGPSIRVIYGDRFTPDGQELRLDSNAGVADTVTFPTNTFAQYDIVGRLGETTRTITGDTQWRIRGIDTENKLLYPAGTVPEDDRYPDDYEVIAQEGDLSAVAALEDALREDALEGRKNRVSDEVRMEMAMQEVTKQVSTAMKDLRNSSNADISDGEIDDKADETSGEIIRIFADQNGGGDGE